MGITWVLLCGSGRVGLFNAQRAASVSLKQETRSDHCFGSSENVRQHNTMRRRRSERFVLSLVDLIHTWKMKKFTLHPLRNQKYTNNQICRQGNGHFKGIFCHDNWCDCTYYHRHRSIRNRRRLSAKHTVSLGTHNFHTKRIFGAFLKDRVWNED